MVFNMASSVLLTRPLLSSYHIFISRPSSPASSSGFHISFPIHFSCLRPCLARSPLLSSSPPHLILSFPLPLSLPASHLLLSPFSLSSSSHSFSLPAHFRTLSHLLPRSFTPCILPPSLGLTNSEFHKHLFTPHVKSLKCFTFLLSFLPCRLSVPSLPSQPSLSCCCLGQGGYFSSSFSICVAAAYGCADRVSIEQICQITLSGFVAYGFSFSEDMTDRSLRLQRPIVCPRLQLLTGIVRAL